jgi:glycerate kinase
VPPLLLAPIGFKPTLRAPVVAAALGRGVERAGLERPDLCALADGGPGTIEVLLPRLGGETADGFCLIEGGGTAIVEDRARLGAAAASGAEVVVYCAAEDPAPPEPATWSAGGPALVVLTGAATPAAAWAAAGARTVSGATFVLDALDFDDRMRAARAVVCGTGLLSRATLRDVVGEAATRARQAGVPAHVVAARDELDLFDRRILDLQELLVAGTVAELEAAGEELGRRLGP